MRVPSAVGCHHDPGLRLASCVTSLTERVCHVTAWMGQVGVKGKLSSVGVEDVSKPAALVPTCAVRLTFPDEARAAAALPRVNAARRGSLVTRAVYDKSRHRVHEESGPHEPRAREGHLRHRVLATGGRDGLHRRCSQAAAAHARGEEHLPKTGRAAA